ncbi:hypothetical protein SCH4B_4352 [Ruegeria sp. TrichCH4B]|nr:hypothetical protein SCH4B_4352 [Ruegeria sp. TrichCH4B]
MTREQQDRALNILHNMAVERTGWRGFFRRWWISDEPLRNDAANLIREVGYAALRPMKSRLVGDDTTPEAPK